MYSAFTLFYGTIPIVNFGQCYRFGLYIERKLDIKVVDSLTEFVDSTTCIFKLQVDRKDKHCSCTK